MKFKCTHCQKTFEITKPWTPMLEDAVKMLTQIFGPKDPMPLVCKDCAPENWKELGMK